MTMLHRGRRTTRALVALIAATAAIAALAMADAGNGDAAQHPRAAVATRQGFHDTMRKLWEDHITWTRLAIVAFAGDLPDLQATENRLLRNQTDIGNAVKPFYGAAAGNKLTALLKEHITGAVALLQAAKANDSAALGKAKADWYANGNAIADFLHAANTRNWPRGAMRSMMKTHLDQTLQEAVDELTGDYAGGVREYDLVHTHILAMADQLSRGIMRQFPRRFRG